MPVLMPSGITGTVEMLLAGQKPETGLVTSQVTSLKAGYDGLEGDTHRGLTRLSCGRVALTYARGTEIRNTRQISIICLQQLAQIARKMDVPEILPEWIGANLCLSGIPDLTCLPPSARLVFGGGPVLVVDMENHPCKYPGEVLEKIYPGKGRLFPKVALGLRGVTAWVEHPGTLRVGDSVAVHVPALRNIWRHGVVPQPA
jgi:hypothetical protein